MKTIQQLAQEFLDNFEWNTRDDGSKFVKTKEDIEWQKEIIFRAHDGRLPNDEDCEQVYDTLQTITEPT